MKRLDPTKLDLSHLHIGERNRIRQGNLTADELAKLIDGENPWQKWGQHGTSSRESEIHEEHMDQKVKNCRAYYVFLDVVQFSKRTPEAQSQIVQELNKIVLGALQAKDLKPDVDCLLLPTGDGMCIALMGEVFDLHLKLALYLLENIETYNIAAEDVPLPTRRRFEVRIGINEGTDILVTDIRGNRNLAGAAINQAFRIMDVADGSQIVVSQAVYGNLHLFEDYLNKFRHFEAEIKHNEKIPVYQFIAMNHRGLNVQVPSKFSTPHRVIEQPAQLGVPKVGAASNLRLVYEPEEGHPFVQSYPGGPTVYRIGVISDREVERATLVANEVTLDGVLHSNVHLRPMHDRDERGTKRVRLSASKMEYWDIVSQDAQGVYLTHIEPIGITAFGIGMNKFELMASSGDAPPVTKIVTMEVGKDNTVSSFRIRDGRISGSPEKRKAPVRLVGTSADFTERQDITYRRKVRCELQNISGQLIRVRALAWISGAKGIQARVVAGTLQRKTSEGKWDPNPDGLQELLVLPSEYFRMWIALSNEQMTLEQIQGLLQEKSLGTVVLLIAGREVKVEI